MKFFTKKGTTMVELLGVVSVLAILVGVMTFIFLDLFNDSKDASVNINGHYIERLYADWKASGGSETQTAVGNPSADASRAQTFLALMAQPKGTPASVSRSVNGAITTLADSTSRASKVRASGAELLQFGSASSGYSSITLTKDGSVNIVTNSAIYNRR